MVKIAAATPVKKEITKKTKLKQKKPKPKNLKAPSAETVSVPKEVKTEPKPKKEATKTEENVTSNGIPEELSAKYPILKNEELIKKFLSVTMTNNQKGRIRQLMKEGLKGTTESPLPDVINNKIQSIMKETDKLTESDLKRIRILYNMLKLSLQTEIPTVPKEKKKKPKNKKAEKDKEVTDKEGAEVAESNKTKEKVKGPKRYVVFVGNLAPDVDKETLMKHFSELSNFIVDVRIPVPAEGKKARIAYLELKNESSYELALSKHHTMLSNRRINVLYSTQKNSKISRTEAKSKSAKLIALQKSGKLAGSIPMNKKRSQRRMKAKLAQKKQEQS